MSPRRIKAGIKARLRKLLPPPLAPTYDISEVEAISRLYYGQGGPLSPAWQPYQHAHMTLPDWFEPGLDPWSDAYAAQQTRLWSQITGIDSAYDPLDHEQDTGWDDCDPVRRPGFYMRRDPAAVETAGDHWLATGMLLKHCGLVAGDRALEYGAGFAQTALALARMGVRVDTVDVSERFCGYVRAQAEFHQVELNAFHGVFGLNPRPGERYKLIWFYESFHHCVDFLQVVPQIAQHLAEGGRIILQAEPIVPAECAPVPYPWGVRLHSEVAAVMRHTGWFELGFTEAFLFEVFRRSGLEARLVECGPSLFGRMYIFERPAPRSIAHQKDSTA